MIEINEKWQNHKYVLEVLKDSKHQNLQDFYSDVDLFNPTSKNYSKSKVRFINKDGKRVDKNQKPKDCVEIMTFFGNSEKGNGIVFSHVAKGGNNNIEIGKILTFKEENGKIKCELSENNKKYSFEIKAGEIVNYKSTTPKCKV